MVLVGLVVVIAIRLMMIVVGFLAILSSSKILLTVKGAGGILTSLLRVDFLGVLLV
jgi:hypothetical protein